MNQETASSSTLSPKRVERFKEEVGELKLSAASGGKERGLLVAGAVLMVAGILVALGAFMSATNLDDFRDQNEMIVLALAGIAMTVAGSALFLRYSLGRLLRYWLLRQIYEGQEHVDRLAERLGR